jgi:hypothetical protein
MGSGQAPFGQQEGACGEVAKAGRRDCAEPGPQGVEEAVAEEVKLVVPYTQLHPLVPRILATYGLSPIYVSLEDDDAYRRLMQRLWIDQETTVIVEHDILPWEGAVQELYFCPGSWCSCSYRLGGVHGGVGIYHGLGCTKLSTKIMAATKGLWDKPYHWSLIDRVLFFAAREQELDPHPHRPPVIHLNERELRPSGPLGAYL